MKKHFRILTGICGCLLFSFTLLADPVPLKGEWSPKEKRSLAPACPVLF